MKIIEVEDQFIKVGQAIADRRTALGLTQADLAVRAGISRRTLCRMELDGFGSPAAFAKVLACVGMKLSIAAEEAS